MAPSGVQRRMTARQIFLKDLNPLLTCTLCRGYLIDATSLVDCFHIFCRACILRYFDNFKLACPTCGVICKKKSNSYRSDPVIQSLVYKLVPGLYSKEVQRREDFYRSTGVRASSSCSEDSVLGDLNDEHEEWVSSTCGDQNQYLSPEDAISLSLEYYNPHLDTGQNSPSPDTCSSTNNEDSTKPSDGVINSANLSAEKTYNCDSNNSNVSGGDANNDTNDNDDKTSENSNNNNKNGLQSNIFDELSDTHKGDRRYLQCPAAVSMTLLHKFLRMKYALSPEHRVDIIYSGEILPQHFTLMDVAYTFQWRRVKPMRFFYRIFIPAKIQPIKIISTPSSDGKQLQVVLAKASSPQTIQNDSTKDDLVKLETDAENYLNKERLMTNLQLQCKVKAEPVKEEESNCVFEYEEPDKDEIREFAEKRDREWALQKKLDEEKEKHRNGKKRKKNKHSKNNVLYKKRKLHAEITSSESLQKEESLKLKVKLTPHNGYKHKHHKSSQSNLVVDTPKPPEMSSKEKLLQMRQVRHKHIPSEDRVKSTAPAPLQQEEVKLPILPENTQRNEEAPPIQNVEKTPSCESSGKTLRSDFSVKTKEIFMQKYPTVQIERNEQTEKHAQKTFLKTFQSYTEKLPQQDKTSSPKSSSPAYTAKTQAQPQLTKSLEEKIANLHQQCTTIEPKPVTLPEPPKLEKKYFTSEKSSTYSTGFTVSKVEVGVKRTPDIENKVQDKRPSLEITLVNPPEKPKPTPIAKRPPPPTIPLERIKKSMNRISGLSIIPKLPEKCDNTGALDLSKPNRNVDLPKPCDLPNKILNGFNHSVKPPERGELSNLQMLSKVATEHPNINKNALVLNKRLPIPNLQTLKIPSPPNSSPKSNLAKLPKLNEISKTQFRLTNPQMRNMRPNQNQSIRNIPNPSLLVRQQNQNRLNSLNTTQNQTETKEPIKVVTTNGESEKSDCRTESKS
ncbi:hypothetical protein RI129_013059 [Pyrocoelia pectoralis]|uniref:RING-type domain-containing protein n=1 Tax=Pyrocoelia pectoralis TaxID=417401 RepID=A0AAN7V8H1_9COLE